MTLFDLLGYHIKANPKYGSEKKGQPTTYYLSAAPEPIRINCEYFYVDVVLSPDPNVFQHTNALAGLKEGGVFIIQSDHASPEEVWESIPVAVPEDHHRQEDQGLLPRRLQDRPRRGHRRRAAAAHAGHRVPGRVLRRLAGDGAGRPRRGQAARRDPRPAAGQVRLKGARVVEDNMRVVKRGFDEITRDHRRAADRDRSAGTRAAGSEPPIPVMVKPIAAEQGADDRHPPLLGADRQLLRPRHGQRQPDRPVHRPGRDAGHARRCSAT